MVIQRITGRGGLYKEPGEQHRGHALEFELTVSVISGLTPTGADRPDKRGKLNRHWRSETRVTEPIL